MTDGANGIEKKTFRNQADSLSEQILSLGPIAELFSVHFKAVEYNLTRITSPAWAKHELRPGTIAALAMIATNPGISQNQLGQGIALDKSGVSAIVNILEKFGWAERRPVAGDRRRNALYASEFGITEVNRVVAEMRDLEARLLAKMSQAEQKQLIALLDRLHDSIRDANF